jgi:hypothetical protein
VLPTSKRVPPQGMSQPAEITVNLRKVRVNQWDEIGVGIGGLTAVRNHLLPKLGLEHPPGILRAVMLPPASLGNAS